MTEQSLRIVSRELREAHTTNKVMEEKFKKECHILPFENLETNKQTTKLTKQIQRRNKHSYKTTKRKDKRTQLEEKILQKKL